MKVSIGNTKVMVSGGITRDGMSKGKVDPCGVSSLRVKANSVLCVQCGGWIHSVVSGYSVVQWILSVNWVAPKFSINFAF